MRIKKDVTLLWDSIELDQAISFTASEMLLKCSSKVSSKCLVIINSQNCVPKQQALKIR